MPSYNIVELCGIQKCRRIKGHKGMHNPYPKEAWDFFNDIDKKKIDKAGYATPRGGSKGAYQNHVYRNGKVIIPYERLNDVNLGVYKDTYVVRLFPEQYFSALGIPKTEFMLEESQVVVGENAFVLYRSYESLDIFPPPLDWKVRYLTKESYGEIEEVNRRGKITEDAGHYVFRLPTIGNRKKDEEGPPQGIFAPEYAEQEVNFLSQCVLAWLSVHTVGSPYTSTQATHTRVILAQENLDNIDTYEYKGVLGQGLTKCPLCMRFIKYEELHSTVTFSEEAGLENAGNQVKGATRSTIVNLFHLSPLIYSELRHVPENVAWGHATCNTRLGQRKCYSLAELIEMELKIGIVRPEGIETFGWLSEDHTMIRSPNGAVWIQLHGDVAEFDPPTDDHTSDFETVTP